MDQSSIDFSEKFSLFSDRWNPRAIARFNDYVFKIARIKGEFIWHSHSETDEVFIVHKGQVRIQLRDGEVKLQPGQMFVVPCGVEHKPVADEEAQIIMVEPEGTRNTGDVSDDRTVEEIEWI